MDTGKVEYAPDYKAARRHIEASYPDMADKFKAMQVRAEHQRLQAAVVEALKACRKMPGSTWEWLQPSGAYGAEVMSAWNATEKAVDALIAFEAEQGIGESE